MSKRAIGIDLGTTNSCVAVYEASGITVIPVPASGARTMPSVVAFTDSGPLVGEAARRQMVMNPQGTIISVKRLMGRRADEPPVNLGPLSVPVVTKNGMMALDVAGRQMLPQEVSALILGALRENAETYLGEQVTDVVITVPAYFNDAQRKATIEAGELAGLNVLRIINEPTAAALAYGLEKREGMILVFDLGGGTFDVSVLDIEDRVFDVKATAGDNELGGDDFDRAIVDHMLEIVREEHGVDLADDQQAMQRLYEAAEKAKRELSGMEIALIDLPFLSRANKEPLHFQMQLTRDQLEVLVQPLIERLREPFHKALEDASLDASDLDEVVLVGGMTRMPLVIELVRSLTGKEPSRQINPDEAVAMGAAIQARALSSDPGEDTELDDVLLMDVTPLTLGIETKGGISTAIIPRNTTIPTSEPRTFTTSEDNQTSVQIHVVQGERAYARDNRTLANISLLDIPPAPRGKPQIDVTFSIDADGVLSVSAIERESGQEKTVRIDGTEGLSDESVEDHLKTAEEQALHDKHLRERTAVRNRAEALAYATERALGEHRARLPEDVRNMLSDAIIQVRAGLKHDDDDLDQLAADLQEVIGMLTEALYGSTEDVPEGIQGLLDPNVPTAEDMGVGPAAHDQDVPDLDDEVDFDQLIVEDERD
jgi:molecular chaperone DnaK